MKNPFQPNQRNMLAHLLEQHIAAHKDSVINEPFLLREILRSDSDLEPIDFECISELIHSNYRYDGISDGFEREA